MQVENLATGKGLVFTRWLWFINPVHGFGAVWSACLILAVLRMTTTTLVSTWSVVFPPARDSDPALNSDSPLDFDSGLDPVLDLDPGPGHDPANKCCAGM